MNNKAENKSLNLTLEEGRKALGVHVLEKGYQLRQKYGHFIDYDVLQRILKDVNFVRFPTEVIFDSNKIEPGFYANTQKISMDAADGYVIYLHDYFKKRMGDVPALVLYQLVTVNYGDFATHNEAEEFASAALGMDKEYYYQYICRLVDDLEKERK